MFTAMVLALALAKPWNGITPGVSSRDDVTQRFGKPSKVLSTQNRDVLAYQKDKPIRGTTQTQFKVDPKTGIVDRIDVFPAPVLTLEDIAAAYGPECTPQKPETAEAPCYLKRADAKNRTSSIRASWASPSSSTPTGKTVQSFAFLPEKK